MFQDECLQTLKELAARWRGVNRPLGEVAIGESGEAMSETVLILTPVKDAAVHAAHFLRALDALTYPKELVSVGLLEGDSADDSFAVFSALLPELERRFRRAALWKKDFGFKLPAAAHRTAPRIQVERRMTLAKARNHLLFHALDDEDWVLWLDVDVIEYPPDIIEKMLKTGKLIVQPHCVQYYGGPTFDRNAWSDHGARHMEDMRKDEELVRLDSVGGAMLFVRADVHRDGLIFPAFPYGMGNPKIRTNNAWLGEIETEGFGIMADDLGHSCWGMPRLEIKHHPC
jgi:hypothetical protein